MAPKGGGGRGRGGYDGNSDEPKVQLLPAGLDKSNSMAGIILIGLVTVGFLVLFIISYISMRTLESKVIGAKGRRPFGIATLALFFWALYAAILTVQQSLVYAESQVPVSFLATSFFSQAFLYLGNVLLLSAVYMVIHNRLQSVGANRKLIWWLHWSAVTIYAILVTAQFIIFARNQTAFMGYARGGYRSDYINDLGTSETYNSAIVTASSVILWLCIFEMILINAFVWTKSRKQNGGKRILHWLSTLILPFYFMSATFELVSCVVFYYSKFVGRPSYYTSLSIGLGNIPLVLVFAGIVMVGKTLTEWAAGLDGAAPTVMAYKVDQ